MRLGATPQPINEEGITMNTKNRIAATCISLLLATVATHGAHAAKDAADAPAKAPSGQQSKMATCNKEAGEKSLKGDERRKFMSGCLSAKKSAK
jgi:hypothetical protein